VRVADKPVILRSRVFALATWLVAAGFGVGALVMVALAPSINKPYGNTLGAAVVLVFASVAFLRGTRMRVEYDAIGVAVYGYFATSRVLWEEFESANADYSGLRVKRRNGDQVTAVCLGKPNWATWLGRRTAADDAAATLNRVASERRTAVA
jgi:hypothetical protein